MRTFHLGLALPVLLAACGAPPEAPVESTGHGSEAISNGSGDYGVNTINEMERDVVVDIDEGHCTGTFLSPGVILTAKHCVLGDSDDPEQDLGSVVWIGPDGLTGAAQTISTLSYVFVYGAYAQESVPADANDLALIFVDPAHSKVQPADVAIIARPSFVAPTPIAGDLKLLATFAPAPQVAGFSPYSGHVDYREALSAPILSRSFDGFSPQTSLNGDWYAYWPSGTNIQKGDSGGPLFVTRTDGTRDVFGVASTFTEFVNNDARYADITIPAVHAWIAAAAQDGSQTNGWYGRHHRTRGDYWRGEVDYTGPCTNNPFKTGPDADCDHWYDSNDDCPFVADTSQADANDDGIGDACPAPAPPRCTTIASCQGTVQVRCDAQPGSFSLQRYTWSPTWTGVASANGSTTIGPVLYDHAPTSAATETYRVCDTHNQQQACGGNLGVTINHAACTVEKLPPGL